MDWKFGGQRRFLQRIGLSAGLFRCDIDSDDVLAALEQRFKHRFAERLLPVNHNTHNRTFPNFFVMPAKAGIQ